MITSSDREYTFTKRIKQGKSKLRAPFSEMAKWIAAKFGVTVLNVVYTSANSLHPPRLEVILEKETDARKFRRGVNYDRQKQITIADQFRAVVGQDSPQRFEVNNLLVVFSAFAPIAAQEADSQISTADVEALKKRIGNSHIWEISRCFGQVTFFFFTAAQAEKYEATGKKEEYGNMYFEVLKPHDEFGYLTRSRFKVQFDSKENFDRNYKSNWFYYYK